MFWLERLYQLKRKDNMDTYKVSKTITKGVRTFIWFALPWLVSMFIQEMPMIANLTIGSLLTMGANWLKHKVGTNLGGLL